MSPIVHPGRERAARLLIACYALATPVAFVLWLTGRWHIPDPHWLEAAFSLLNVPVAPSLVSIVLLALITLTLVARKRFGLWMVALTQISGMYLGIAVLLRLPWSPDAGGWDSVHRLYRVLDIASLPLGAVILVVLWWLRREFPARLRPGSWIKALAVGAGGLLITAAVTMGLVGLTTAGPPLPRFRTFLAVLLRALGQIAPDRNALRDLPPWVPEVTSLLTSLTLLAAVTVFMASARSATRWSGDREVDLRRLIRRFGADDSLAYFATRRDKSSIFSTDGNAAVTYRVQNGVSLASGDPIGDPAAWASAVSAWLTEARRYGWLPAVIGASERGARTYAAAGLQLITLGDEAILDKELFRLGTTSMAPLRHAVRRTARAGVTTRIVRQGDLGPDEVAEIVAKAKAWRDGRDRGFSMALNRLGDPADKDVLFITAHQEGRIVGVLGFVPWGRRDLSLELMRHAPDAPNGVTERMVCDVLTSRDVAARRVSLNFCMFRRTFADAAQLGAGMRTRLNSSVLGWFDRIWQLERLYLTTQRYQPRWERRFLCVGETLSLPQVAFAAASAEGFLPPIRVPGPPAPPFLDPVHLEEVLQLDRDWEAELAAQAPRRGDQAHARLRHREELLSAGIDPYPAAGTRPDVTPAELAAAAPGRRAHVGGRVRRLRDHGGVVFADITDGQGSVQILVEGGSGGRDAVRQFARLVDVGDLVGVTGTWGSSRTGTPSLLADRWTMEAKCLRPIPWNSLTDPETRTRRRAEDLIVHPEGLTSLTNRARVVSSLRATLAAHGFIEVETPMLQVVHGGAAARPFRTRSIAYDLALSLRIAPELALKRLVVAGFGPVYELGRNFRNEGADQTHNPEFTSVEAYLPHADYNDMRHLTEELIRRAAVAVHGRESLPTPDGAWVDISGPWPVVPVLTAVSEALGQEVGLETDPDVLLRFARRNDVPVRDEMGPGAIIEGLYGRLVEARTAAPTFYTDFPQETSPLTRPHRSEPGLVERWDLVFRGMELGTAYSELADPVDQRRRFLTQSWKAAAGDPEAMELDEDFLATLEVGMPPTGGLGLGVDRLSMAITGDPLRALLTFPFMRPVRAQTSVNRPASPSR
jgi:lysyl-tRNA synthetase class 2